ncbi:MAG: LCP family protein [Cyanobacteria bacterium J06600_6]
MARLTERNSEPSSNIPQVTPLHQPLWFWLQHSRWSYFNRGLFWGGLVSLTSIFSALGGMALTTIDVVERQISQQLAGNSQNADSSQLALATPLQILLVEVQPNADALVGFSPASTGESKNVLLVELEPDQNFARVLNIPANSQIEIPEFGIGTVKDAYRLGGIDLLSRSLNQSSDEIAIDRYIRASPEIFKQLSSSGKINLTSCDSRLRDCSDLSAQAMRQQTVFKTIRQRLNIPGYFSSFKTAIAQVESQLDTDISMPELISAVNFIKELESDRLSVALLPEYTPLNAQLGEEGLAPNSLEPFASLKSNLERAKTNNNSLSNKSVAVQNTTDDPELGRRVVAYLRARNFSDVYLVRHIPLKLEKTRIVTNYGQVETANYLKNILGFGSLAAKSDQQQQMVLQLGEDALSLPPS